MPKTGQVQSVTKDYPTTEQIVSAVCAEINVAASDLYSKDIQAMCPVTAQDILSEPGKYRVHSDVRVISAIIMRKHVLLPFSFDQKKHPTYIYIGEQLKTKKGGGGLEHRMFTMCQIMRINPVYRGVYVRAVKTLQSQGISLHRTDHIETSAPCQ